MAFTGEEDHSISLEDASKLTENYRKEAGEEAILAKYFSHAALEKILDQEGCVGIRIYYGQKDDGTPVLVLVGANSDEDDLVDGELAEYGTQCPPNCATPNALNS